MFLRCFCLSLVSFGVRVLLSHSVCSDKAANTCQGTHENAKLLMAIAAKMQVRKKEAVMLLFTKKKRKNSTTVLAIWGLPACWGYVFIYNKRAEKEQMLLS